MNASATPYSNLKIFHHTELLNKIKNGERVPPIYIRIKPTNVCNQNCYYCHYKNSYLDLDDYLPKDFIPREKMLEIIDDMADMGVKAVTFSGGGEPLVYPYIEETMQKALDSGIDLSIITNGTLLKDKKAEILAKAKWVRLSVDSSRKEMYAKTRSVPEDMFSELLKNIENFAKIKDKTCELGINFVVNEKNHEYVYEMAELMKSLGANHVKFTPAISNETEKYHAPFMREVMEDLERAAELNDEHFRVIDLYTSDFNRVKSGVKIFDRAYDVCYIKEMVCVIAANSKVYYCHDKAYLNDGCIGDLKNMRFKDLWFSDKTMKLFKNFDVHKVCYQHCVYDDRNIMLNQFFGMDMNHVNFL